MNRLTIQISDCFPTMRTGTNLAVKRSLAHKCRFPVKPHAHAHATDNKKLLARRLRTQLFAQLDELEQGIGAIEHPNLGTRDGFENFPAPLVDQVRWAQDQGASITFRVENGCQRDADNGLARAHLALRSEEHTSALQSIMRLS